MWNDYDNYRKSAYREPFNCNSRFVGVISEIATANTFAYRPEAEGRWALPQHEFGDVIAWLGYCVINTIAVYLRFMSNFSNATVGISPRTVSNLLARYDELLAVKLGDSKRLKEILNQQQHDSGYDGLQPDMGQEVLG